MEQDVLMAEEQEDVDEDEGYEEGTELDLIIDNGYESPD